MNIACINRVHRDKMAGFHDRKGHEGKTPGSILCGLVLGFDADNKKISIYATPNCPTPIY
jgi:hypothetical protein